jgi:hypothetical protein
MIAAKCGDVLSRCKGFRFAHPGYTGVKQQTVANHVGNGAAAVAHPTR